jgi:hypothetical protein
MGMREAGPGGGAHVDASQWIRSSTGVAPAVLRMTGREGCAPEWGAERWRVGRVGTRARCRFRSATAAQALGHGG